MNPMNKDFSVKAELAIRDLFKLAKAQNELQFAFSLSAEFRGLQGPGWNTAIEAHKAINDYNSILSGDIEPSIRARIALGFYCHLAEASGFYEVPKNMLRVVEGHPYSLCPFQHLVKAHKENGTRIAPNSNKVICDLVGHSESLGLHPLAEVFRDAFDGDLRNGYAHADYVIWDDGIRLPKRNGGGARIVGWPNFDSIFERGLDFFLTIDQVIDENVRSYNPEKQISARLSDEPEQTWNIHFDPESNTFSISG